MELLRVKRTSQSIIYGVIVILLGLAIGPDGGAQRAEAALGEALAIVGDEPLYVKAESLRYVAKHQLIIVEGSVEISYRESRLTADYVEFDQRTGDVVAIGNVRYTENGESIAAQRTELNLDSELGTILKGDVSLEGDHYISGAEIEKVGDDTYMINAGTYTACSADNPAWSFRCTRAKVEQGEYLQAWNTVGYVKGIPIIYFPYFIFPMKTERQSGFLVPHVGHNTANGFTLTNAYFWAISSGQDLTLTHNYYEQRGHRFDLEYRYLYGQDAQGQILGKYFPDQELQETLRRLSWDHRQTLWFDVKSIINAELTSNDQFDKDFETDLSARTQRELRSTVSFTKNFSRHTLRLLLDREDNLQEENADQARQRFPELQFKSQFPSVFGTPLNFSQTTVAAHLEEEGSDAKQFQRWDSQATLTVPLAIVAEALTVTPSVHGRMTYYSRDAETAANFDLAARSAHQYYYDASLDINGPKLNRIFDLGSMGRTQRVKHLIEPTLSLSYRPAVDAVNVPKFDGTDLTSRNRSRSLSYGITQRLLAKRITAGDWERFQDDEDELLFEDLETEITELASLSLNQSYNFEADRRKFSDISMKFSARPLENSDVTVNAAFDVYVESFVRTNVNVQTTVFDHWNIGLQWDRTAVVKTDTDDITAIRRFLSLNTGLTLFDRLALTYRSQLNVENGKRLNDTFGLTYNAQCWNVRGTYAQQLIDDEREDSFNIMLELTNLGKLFDIKG